jgi:Protein of unknown function (DUF2723)
MNSSFRTLNNIAGWLTFGIAAIVLGMAAERTGSLWDCGEFISGAYKLQVVHPPGAPVFLLVGRLFTWVASLVSNNPEHIAFSVNLLSALCTAFTALFVCWSTTILARLTLAGRAHEPEGAAALAVAGAGIVAGLSTAFTTSIWFSAVEGEVYAMSTFFTAMTLWATLKWYNLPDNSDADRWLVFAMFSSALSIGVHLLSLLTFPALAMFYYFKKSKQPSFGGVMAAAGIGVAAIVLIQKLIIVGIPNLWAMFDKWMVNGLGMPFYTGIIPVMLIFGGAIWYALNYAHRKQNGLLQRVVVALSLVILAYLSYGMVIIRAMADTPINMNAPSDPLRLLPYLNREQYGERPLLYGAHFDAKPSDMVTEERYGRVGDRYEVVDQKMDYEYFSKDKALFPRMGDYSQGRPALYRRWIDKSSGTPSLGDNIEFFWKYQLGWMYWRYFMWNFAGRQNGEQGYYAWNPTSGHWISGISFIDEARLGDMSKLPEFKKNEQGRNKYYLVPFLLGLLGMFFHYQRRRNDFAAIFALFIITGIGIIVYSNQPPNEPRERDYVLAGSFFTFTIWIGLSVVAIYQLFAERLRLGALGAGAATLIGLAAPGLMVTQNWDDHSRSEHFASRDYARNFLESVEPNAIIFTYGDNDTYPLWYCQEVENIRTDVRVVNLSLIATDWYIGQLRRSINNSPAIAMSIPQDQLRGSKRMQVPYYAPQGDREMTIQQVVRYIGEDHKLPSQSGSDFESHVPTKIISIPVNRQECIDNKIASAADTSLVDAIRFDLGKDRSYLIKDEVAILDIIASNFGKRPIYWAVTCREEKLMGLDDYLQLEGLSLQLVPKKTASDRSYGMIGAGCVDTDRAYRNIMEKWRWGNFDKKRLYVDRSYMPSLQTMRVTMIRLGQELIEKGDKEKAIALADKYFEVFPFINFQPDQFAALATELYARSGAMDKAGQKAREIAKSLQEELAFFNSLSPAFQKGYQQEEEYAVATVRTLIRMATVSKDDALRSELTAMFSEYMPTNAPPLPGMNN